MIKRLKEILVEFENQRKKRGWQGFYELIVREIGMNGIRGIFVKIGYLVPKVKVANTRERRYFLESLYQAAEVKSDLFEDAKPSQIAKEKSRVRVTAFVLPQFHSTPENDQFWGKNFTEWTNSTKALPQYIGQHQPQLPHEIGYYDMSRPETVRAQAEMALRFGVSAFCFHYYWFSGRKVLHKPLDAFLAQPDLPIEFCVNWANENWTRRWDGREQDVLLAQSGDKEDYARIFNDWLPIFRDPRYMRTPDGKPILIVYRPRQLAAARSASRQWRKLASENGFTGIHILMTNAFDDRDYRSYEFDGVVEFPPHGLNLEIDNLDFKVVNDKYRGQIYDMSKFFRSERFVQAKPEENVFRTVFPSWDNEARKPGRGFSFFGVTPDAFQAWLTRAAETTSSFAWPNRQKLVFINAWNEWAEGAHLEPDRRYGYAYLNRVARVVEQLSND